MQSVASTYPEKPSRNVTSRVFAVLALIIVGVVVAALISTAVKDSKSSPTHATTTQASTGPKHDYYVVKAGDSFAGIAAAEGIDPERLKQLNPSLDPLQLQPENCIDLVADGCKQLANGG
jgi:LysM repeat protein